LVQDNGFSKEFYPRFIATKSSIGLLSMKYREHLAVVDSTDSIEALSEHTSIDPRLQFGDKQPYFAVSIPGETDWVRSHYRKDSQQNSFIPIGGSGSDFGPTDKQLSFEKKHPLAGINRRQAIIKFYGNGPGDSQDSNLTLNDVIEVVGVYEMPIGVELPVIHAIAHRDLQSSGGHPQFRPCFSLSTAAAADRLGANRRMFCRLIGEPLAEKVPLLRQQVIDWLATEVCLGDRLVAETLLLWTLGRVHRRMGETALGPLSLTISQAPLVEQDQNNPTPVGINQSSNWFVQRFKQAMDLLLPQTVLLPLAVEVLNSANLVPTLRDIGTDLASSEVYSNGFLDAGVLQLPSGTSLIIDETSMTAGQLAQKGLQNLAALRELLTFYSLTYQNSNGLAAFEKDLQLLIIRSGSGSLRLHQSGAASGSNGEQVLPTDLTIPLQAHLSVPPVGSAISEPANLDLLRLYLAYYRVAGPESHTYDVPDAVAKLVEEQFVQSRQQDLEERRMTQDDLFKLLSLARLMSLSYGKSELNEQIWEQTKQLYQQLRDRQ
jgi:hypothetical protein